MEEELKQLDLLILEKEIDKGKIQKLMNTIINSHLKGLKIENYIGDYPTFMEPVILGDSVKIGDDVLLGPRIYIGTNSEIGNYVEISNSIIFDNVKIGENIKLDNCVIAKDCKLNFNNFFAKDCILKGIANSQNELEIIPL
ncbi:MAG: hypothetical protein ACFFBI_09065 [Promethearchaeota archaeon]